MRLGIQMIVVDEDEQRVLLGRHERGPFRDLYSGFLGDAEPDESPQESARRIAREQAGIEAQGAELRAILEIRGERPEPFLEYEFVAHAFSGTPTSTDAITPLWFPVDALPFEHMPADDALWYPPLLAGALQTGQFEFAHGENRLVRHVLRTVDRLDPDRALGLRLERDGTRSDLS